MHLYSSHVFSSLSFHTHTFGLNFLRQLFLALNHMSITHTHTHNRLMAFGPGQPGLAGTRRNTHPLTSILNYLIIGHPLSSSSIYNDQWHPLHSFYVLDSPLVQPLSRSSLVLVGLPLGLGPSSSYSIHFFTQSSSSFRSTCHTNAACSAAIPVLCHLMCAKA